MKSRKLFTAIENIHVQNDSEFINKLKDNCNKLLTTYKTYRSVTATVQSVINPSHGNNKQSENTATKIEINVNNNSVSDFYLKSKVEFEQTLEELSELISARFNINDLVLVANDNFYGVLCVTYPLSFHIFNNSGFFNKKDLFTVIEDEKIGTIDLKNAKLKGSISNLETNLIMNLDTLVNVVNISGDELAAAIMHEIGHIFNMFGNLYRINYSIDNLEQAYKDNEIKSNPDKIVLTVVNSIKALDRTYEYKNETIPVLTAKLYKKLFYAAKTSLFSFGYLTEEEDTADVFSARMGMSKELVSLLQKLNKFEDHNLIKYNFTMINVSLESLFMLQTRRLNIIMGLLAGISAAAVITVFPVASLILLVFSLSFSITGIVAYLSDLNLVVKNEHPNNYFRTDNIKKELIRQLKSLDGTISKDLSNKLLDDIDNIDNILSNIKNSNLIKDERSLLDVEKYLNMGKHDRLENTLLERTIQNLTNSDLFVDSAKLKQLGEV